MKCFYHRDMDGKCAGFWVYLSAGLYDGYAADSKFININYGMDFPFDDIKENEQVYIVDYSISPDEMRRLLTITKDVTWIDHHKTAIAKYEGFEHELRGVRYDGVAGCMLTYCYLHHMTERGQGEIKPFDLSMTEDAPMFTKLLADYDVWTFEFGDDTRYFQTGVNSYDFEPTDKRWDDFSLYNNEQQYIEEGKTMIKYRDNWAKDYCKCKGFETEFEGHKCYAMNLGLCGSDYFISIDDGSYEILIAFSYNGKDWSVSLYSKTVDVSDIAKKYGGGGHRGAAGFSTTELLFKRIDE